MLSTLSGIVTLVRLVQSSNAQEPMLVTLSGIVTLVRLEQLSNAYSPMLVTGILLIVSGITIVDELLEDFMITIPSAIFTHSKPFSVTPKSIHPQTTGRFELFQYEFQLPGWLVNLQYILRLVQPQNV